MNKSKLYINSEKLEQVDGFVYFGRMVTKDKKANRVISRYIMLVEKAWAVSGLL